MKKNWFIVLPLLLAVLILPVSAAMIPSERGPRLVDDADLLYDYEETALIEVLDEVSEAWSCDVVVLTTDSLGGTSAQAYADDYFDDNGYGYGADYTGILFLISMTEREWAISTCGGAIDIFTDAALMAMEDEIIPYLSSGDYAAAFTTYAELCDGFLERAAQGEIYGSTDSFYSDPYYAYSDPYYNDYYNDSYYYSDPYGYRDTGRSVSALWIPGSVLIAFVLSLIVVNTMKGEMNSVHMQSGAAAYEKQGSFKVTERRDLFLYRNISKTPRQTEQNHSNRGGGVHGSSVHRSSSGRSHGGRSGRF